MAIQVSTLFLIPYEADRLAEGHRLVVAFLSSEERAASPASPVASHPDLLVLEPPAGKASIGIDQVRELVRSLYYAPDAAMRKVCLIPHAETLTGPAANALLKAIEEPPRDALFVLLARHAAGVLPTIVSRLRVQRVVPPPPEESFDRLRAAGIDDESAQLLLEWGLTPAELAAAIAGSGEESLARATKALSEADDAQLVAVTAADPHPLLRRWAARELLQRVAQCGATSAVSVSKTIAAQGRDKVLSFVEDVVRLTARAARQAWSSSSGSAAMAEGRTSTWLCRAAQDARRACERYAPPEAVLLALLLDVAEAGRG